MAYSSKSKAYQISVPDEEFSCPLCCEIFEEPKLLPKCGHSFCKSCLRKMILHNGDSLNISCPVCRKISKVPNNDVEELATNNLLVRLIDNIPGRQERQMIVNALAKCKKEVAKLQEVQDELEEKISKIQARKEQGLKLKEEINKHAQAAIDQIRQWEQNCCKKVDLHLSKNCGLAVFEQLHEHLNSLQVYAVKAGACCKSADEMLERNEMKEFLLVKDDIVAKLNECSTLPQSSLPLKKLEDIQDFNLELQKADMNPDIGKVVKRDQATGSAAGICSSESAAGLTPTRKLRFSSRSETWLEFAPFQMAVCPRSGDVALLWEQKRQVHIYNNELQLLSGFSILYGDLWDVAFTNDGKVIVVNRSHNKLLLYDTNGKYIYFEVERPQESVKFTYVSVDVEGRFVVTSTWFESDEEDAFTTSCVIIYNSTCKEPVLVFGENQLVKPLSRAILLNEKFYIADEFDDTFAIKIFCAQGNLIKTINFQDVIFVSLSTNLFAQHFSDLIVVHAENDHGDDQNCIKMYYIKNGTIDHCETIELQPGVELDQAVVILGCPNRPVQQLEIYEDKNSLCKVTYMKS